MIIVFTEESPKQGVVQAECIEATDDDYATACYRRAACEARHSPGGERANIRATREIPETWCNSIAIRSKVCYNKTGKAVGI